MSVLRVLVVVTLLVFEMSIFDAYDSEFSALSQDISKNISEYRTYSSNPADLSFLFSFLSLLLSLFSFFFFFFFDIFREIFQFSETC